MEMVRVNSSLIFSVGYDPEGQELHVIFKKPRDKKYVYEGVSPEFYQDFMESDSLGGFFHQSIKGKLEHRVEALD
jgi:hypothetical protein